MNLENMLNNKIKDLKPSGIRRFFDMASEYKDIVSLGVGEPDFDTPWHIRQEAIKALQEGRTFYTANAGLKELREEVCIFTEGRHGVNYDPMHECVITVGGSEAVDISMRVLLNPGDEVIICDPGYVSYVPAVTMADGTPVILPLKEENQFRLTPEELEAAITPKTKAIILSFPNNPTGAVMSREDLEAIAKVILKHNVVVISDEIYSELTYTGNRHVSIVEIEGMKERTVLINGFSKAFAMTGWRMGYALAPEVLMKQMIKIHQFTIMAAPTTSQYAGIDALKNCDDDVIEMRESYNQRRRYLLKKMEELGLPCFEPFGAFYIFPNISQFGMTSEEFATKLVQEERVAVVPGSAFGESGEGFVRISYAYSLDSLKKAIERLESFIHKLRNGEIS